MITIVIDEKTNRIQDMVYLLEKIAKDLESGITHGYYPHWHINGEEDAESEA